MACCVRCKSKKGLVKTACCDLIYCGNECAIDDVLVHAYECISANVNIDSVQVDKVLGEGSFGCVLKSTDSKYAIKIQEERSGSATCRLESETQMELSQVQNAAVGKIYFFSSKVTSIPLAWRRILESKSTKGPMWRQRQWRGNFCVIMMEFLQGDTPKDVTQPEMKSLAFGLLYTIRMGYKQVGFQHIDIKPENIMMISIKKRDITYGTSYKFELVTRVPRLLDFGLAYTSKTAPSMNIFSNMGGDMRITPPEVLCSRLTSFNPAVQSFLPQFNKRYHWSYDLYSIGVTLLMSGPSADYCMERGLQKAIPYMQAFAQALGHADPAGLMFSVNTIYNLCIINHLLGNGAYPTKRVLDTYYGGAQTSGYMILGTDHAHNVINYLIKHHTNYYKGQIDEFKTKYGTNILDLIKKLIHWDPEQRGGGVGILDRAYALLK